MNNHVVVTGMGLVAPLCSFGPIGDFWGALCSGEDAVRLMPPPLLYTPQQWPMARIEVPDHVTPDDKFRFLTQEAMKMAIGDAGLDGYSQAGLTIGTVLGNILSKELRMFNATKRSRAESLSCIAPDLAERFALEGRCSAVSTACASGTDAIGIAARRIGAGKASVMIAGGADVLSDFAILGFNVLQALTGTKVRPFCKNRSGLALGEGAAFVVLESSEHATRRGAKIYGRILGYASRCDAHHLTAPHREGRGLADAVAQSLIMARLEPNRIDYINAHGTGTVYNDLMETVVIKKVFGQDAYNIPVSSTKSMLGHSFGAAGAIESICCLLSINKKKVPPTINFDERDPLCDLDYVPNESRQHDVRVAMSLSAGFGGQNSALIFGEA